MINRKQETKSILSILRKWYILHDDIDAQIPPDYCFNPLWHASFKEFLYWQIKACFLKRKVIRFHMKIYPEPEILPQY